MINHLRIPDPCQQQWNGMEPQENGRYCGSCQQTVIDFTNASEQEIIDYFAANAGKKSAAVNRVIVGAKHGSIYKAKRGELKPK